MSLRYERDPSFEDGNASQCIAIDGGAGSAASGQGLGQGRGGMEGEPMSSEEAAAMAEEARAMARERRRLYVRLLVGAGLLVLSAAVVMLGLSLYSMEFSSRDLWDTLLPVVLGLVPFAMAFAGFLVLRLGTFRILSVDPDSATAYVIYNHRGVQPARPPDRGLSPLVPRELRRPALHPPALLRLLLRPVETYIQTAAARLRTAVPAADSVPAACARLLS